MKHHSILGLGDAQVTWLGAQAIARSTNAVMYISNAKENDEEFFGFEMISDTTNVTGRSGTSQRTFQLVYSNSQ